MTTAMMLLTGHALIFLAPGQTLQSSDPEAVTQIKGEHLRV